MTDDLPFDPPTPDELAPDTPPKRRRGRKPRGFFDTAARTPERQRLVYLVYILEPYSTTILGAPAEPPRTDVPSCFEQNGQRLMLIGATENPELALRWLAEERENNPQVVIAEEVA